jgi:capsular exopolysaccharide synthesis family protein
VGKVSNALNKAESKQTAGSSSVAIPQKLQEFIDQPQELQELKGEAEITPPPRIHSRVKGSSSHHHAEANTKNWDERLISSTNDVTGVADGIRKVRNMILHSNSGTPIRSVLVLSSDPQEGKSFVCANLGISFAKSVEHQALLVDCDLRRPCLHKLFGINMQRGLADYLDHGEDVTKLIVGTGLPKLELIPAGSPVTAPAELLSSTKIPDMLEELSSRRDHRLIILDTPPFYAASETILLSQLVDAIVVVVRWGRSGRENVRKMVETIGREKIIGTIFNAFEMNILDRRIQGVGYGNYFPEYY